jgi:DNA repair exonuclease SbcCD ATPase subunit
LTTQHDAERRQAYVHDLEDKIKSYDETSVTSSGSITDLKRELARFKDTESHSTQYIVDLETRLARADESVLGLQKTVEQLEYDVERRRAEVENLQGRLDAITKDGEAWRDDLERRERRVQDLEQRMQEWERVRAEAGDQRARLGAIVDGVEQEKRALETPPGSPRTTPALLNGHVTEPVSEPVTPVQVHHPISSGLEVQIASLQETHAATLADLSSVAAKYRDALREISDLAAQIQELKLNGEASSESGSVPASDRLELQTARRRLAPDSPTSRRLFGRNAASTESLRSRSLSQSLSLSQELSSAHGRKTSLSSAGASSPLAASPRVRPLALSLSFPAGVAVDGGRSAVSMEKEIKALQDVLKEREAEIAALETTLRERGPAAPAPVPALMLTPEQLSSPESPSPGSAAARLTPNTLRQFGEIRKAIGNGHTAMDTDASSTLDSVSEEDENLDRLNELMRLVWLWYNTS